MVLFYLLRHSAINLVWRISPNVDDVISWATWAVPQLGGRPGRSEDSPHYPWNVDTSFVLALGLEQRHGMESVQRLVLLQNGLNANASKTIS
jgi:hypothetical protein